MYAKLPSLMIFATLLASAASTSPNATERLFDSLRNGDSAGVRAALSEGASVNAKDAEGSTPLMYAALYSSGADNTRLLLKQGAEVNAANNFGATALIWGTNSLEKVRLLVEYGAEVNARSKLGKSALMVAASRDGAGPVVRYLLAHGARTDFKDELAGMPVIPLGGGGTTALIQAAKARDAEALTLLIKSGADVHVGEKNGSTALLNAIASGNRRNVRLLLDSGADVAAANAGGFSALILAAMREDAETIRVLLEHGPKVDAEDMWGSTPLMWAAASERAHTEPVKLLLDAHADINHKNKMGDTAYSWAARRGKTAVVDLLQQSGAAKPSDTPGQEIASVPNSSEGTLFARVEQTLPLLQKAGPAVFKNRGCMSCHNNMLPTVAVTMARSNGHKVDEKALDLEHRSLLSVFKPAQEVLAENGDNVPDLTITGPYALMALAAQGHKPDALTDAAVHNLANKQNSDGSWAIWAPRPPIESGDIQATALSLRALQLYPLPGRQSEFDRQVKQAGKWLAQAKPETNYDLSWRTLGLFWSKSDPKIIDEAVGEILKQQRADGGWAQLPGLQSDAYATGQTLYALGTVGALKGNPGAWSRAIDFLLRTQQADGTWMVKHRAFPVQPYFESGFPYGHDQWISMAGSSWATIALTMAEAEGFNSSEALLRKP